MKLDKVQVKEIVSTLIMAYPQIQREYEPKKLLSFYYDMLHDEDYVQVLNNLKKHIATSEFPPKVSELLKGTARSNIPTAKETKQYLDSLKNEQQASKEQVEYHLKKIREILNIERE